METSGMDLLNFTFTAVIGNSNSSDHLVDLGVYDTGKHKAYLLGWNEF